MSFPDRPVSALMGAGRSAVVRVVPVVFDRARIQDREYRHTMDER
jgi:hypothetical protein